MTVPALASPSDLAAFLKVAIDDDDASAELVLRLASAQVRQAANLTWLDDEGDLADVPEVAFTVCLQAAARGWLNPSGATQSSTGPFQASFESGVILTSEEREQIAALNPSAVAGLSHVTMRAGVNPSRVAYGRWPSEYDDD